MILGILIVLVGIAVLVKAIFHLDIPILRIAFGLFLIYLGVELILGWTRWHRMIEWGNGYFGVFGEQEMRVGPAEAPQRAYTVVFGRTVLDLSDVAPVNEDVKVELNVVFGDARVKVAPATPIEIVAQVAFGRAELPGTAQVALGRQVYRSETAATAAHLIRLRSNVVFGNLELDRS